MMVVVNLITKKETFRLKTSKKGQPIFMIMFRTNSIFLFLILFPFFLRAQEATERYLEVRGISELNMEPLPKATVNLYDGSSKIQTLTTGLDGSFSFKLNINKQYTIEVEKDGLVSKRIFFNTTMPDEEKGTWMNEFSIGLVKPCNGVDYSVLKQPVDQVKFDAKRREFLSDKDYVNSMRPKMEALMIKTDQCMLANYETLVKKADQTAQQKNYGEAIDIFREALKIYPTEEYPAKRIAEINSLINKQQFSAEAYQKLITDADALMAQEKTNEALQNYKRASTLNPSETYAKQKISEIEKKLAEQQALQQAQTSKEERYNQAMAKASVAYTRKDYASAKTLYEEALSIKPGESLPKSRVQEIETILTKKAAEDAARAAEAAKKADADKEYLSTIAQADALFKEKKFEEAKVVYAKALSLRPAESYPAQRVKAIQNAVANEQAAVQKSKDEAFESAMASANAAIAKNQFPQAKEFIQKALTIKPDDAMAKGRLEEVDRLADNFARQKSLAETYASNIQAGDAFLAKKQYSEAKESYAKAITAKPGDKYAASKITAVENIIAAEQAASLKAQTETFNSFVSEGNNAIARNEFQIAKESFQKALTIRPEDPAVKKKLSDIDRLAEAYTKQKSLNEQYEMNIQSGDAFLAKKQLSDAKESYLKALNLKPGDKLASTKITNVENAIAADQAAVLKNRNDQYNTAIAEGNNALAKNQFDIARESFQKALLVKPDDISAKTKLAETEKLASEYTRRQTAQEQYRQIIQNADALLAAKDLLKAKEEYKKALVVLPSDAYAQGKITAIDNTIAADQAARLKNIEEGYKAAIGAANTSISQKAFPQAKEQLQKALSFKPGDNYASTMIAQVDRLIEEQQKQAEDEKLRTRQYNELITSADKLMADKDYQGAKAGYYKALQAKPGDSYATQKISAADNLIIAQQELKKKQTEEAYSKAMLNGSSALVTKNFTSARESFNEALTIKPGDNIAKQKLNETELLIKQDEEKKMAEQAKKKRYEEIIKSADQLFTSKDFMGAKSAYNMALGVIPGDVYARQKLDETTKLIEEQERIKAESKARESAYNQSLVNADKYFRGNDLLQAKNEYSRALTIKPNEAFPKTRLAEIEKLIQDKEKEQAQNKARLDAYTASINSGNSLFAKKDYPNAKISYTEALKHMPGDVLATEQIKKIDYHIAETEKMRQAEEAKRTALQATIASADKAFDGAKYQIAKEEYKKVLTIDPANAYAKQRIARIDEINKVLAQPATKPAVQNTGTASTSKVTAAIAMKDLNFRNESERQKYLDELKEKYPSGITLEKYKEPYKETYRYIIIRDNVAQEYRHIKYTTYGGAQYSVNGKPITQQYFLSQTKIRSGETLNEIDMQ